MKLYFVRHGETDVNSGLQQSDTAQFDEPLNTIGIAQAKLLAEQLRDVKFEHIFCSPSQRALHTAAIINVFHKLDIQVDNAWKELQASTYLDATSWHDAFDFDKKDMAEDVEPVRDLFKRVYTALDNLKAHYGKDDAVLVVSHGGTHQAVHAYANKLSLTGNMRKSPMKNCDVRIYEIK